jgi:hypothetical protein
MLPLDDPSWAQLSYAYGSASTLPKVILHLQDCIDSGAEPNDDLMDTLWDTCHQWTTYDSTYATLPHLVRICARSRPEDTSRIMILTWIGWCVACLRLNQTEAPDQLVDWFEESVPVARDLIAQSLPYVDVRETAYELRTLRGLLAAFATCHGNASLGFVLYELEAGGTKCGHCGNFFQPMKSSLNPFWLEQQDGYRREDQ